MARQETIEIKLIYDAAKKSLETLKGQADELKKTLSAVNIGDAKSYATIAKAEKDLATASMNRAKAEKLSADAITAKMRAEKAAAVTATAKLKQDQQAAKTSADQAKADLANAKTKTQLAKAETEIAKAESIRTRQTILLNREQERQSAAMRRLGQDIGQVNASQAQSIQYMSQWIRQQEGLSNATVHATGAINNANGSFQTYRAAVSEAGGATHNYRMAVNTATGEVYQLDQGIRTTAVSLRDMSSILRAVRTVVGFTGIAQSMRSAFAEMKSMSDAMAEYRKVTGTTSQEMEALRGTAYEVAKAYGESASGVIASAANMARAGYKENSLAMAELATKTKLAGDMTQEAADKFLIAVDAAYKYQGNVEQLSAILDAANEIDNNYATTISHIAEGTTLVASLAATAKVPIEQMIAALGTMQATTQRSGSEIARGYRYILLHAMGDTETEIEEGVTATEEAVQTLTDAVMKYGDQSVKSAVQAGKLINPMEKIVALQKAYKEGVLTDEALYAIGSKVAGQRYYNVFSALITNPEMYNDMLQSISQSMGSAQNEIDILMDSWSKKLERLNTTWTQVVNNTVSENFIKGLIDGGRQALEFAGNLENLAIMAGGAYEAIRSLSTGIANLRSGAQFGGFNIATSLVGLAITGIGIWKSAYEKNIRDIQASAAQAVASALEESSSVKTIEGLVKRYSEIASDGIQTEQGELEELKTLQDELNGLVGDQASAIDIVNGKYSVTISQLQNLTEKQKEAAKETLRTALSGSVAAFNTTKLTDYFNYGTDWSGYANSGIQYGPTLNTILSGYLQESEYISSVNGYLKFIKPDNAEGIAAFYRELQDLYKFLGTTTPTGEKAAENARSLGEEYSGVYSALGNLINKVKEAGAGNIQSTLEELANLDKALENVGKSGGSAKNAAEGIETVTESAYDLADAIAAATAAKEKFDDAMKTSKADAFNDYVQAFQTLQGEINAGRVNSTAFYASARMLLGDDAYNRTGGTSEGVMAALNRKGSSGTLNRAGELLFGEYYNENGELFEGAGLIELLRNTKGYGDRITQNANGGWNIPGLTEADINEISAAWGGLSKNLIMAFFEALDQSDIKGEATAEAVKAAKTETAGAGTTTEKPELPERVIEQQNRLAESTQALGEAQEKAAEQTAEALQTVENATSETEELKEVNPDTTQARTDAEEWLELLTAIEEAYERINTQTVGYSPDLEKLFEDIDKLREEITLNIKTGAGTGTAALMASVLSAAITTIEGYAKNGTISVTLAAALTGNLKDGLAKIIDDAQSIEELKAIELALTGNPSQLDSDVGLAVAKENLKKVVLTATAETKDAEDQIDKAAEDRDTTIKVKQSGAETASRAIDNAAKPRIATIKVKLEETGGTGTASPNVSGRSSTSLNYTNGGGGTAGDAPLYNILDAVGLPTTKKWAHGTRSHPGGLSMVNDGNGPELIIDNGRAFIAGDGRPAIVSLNKGAKVFTASETRQIFSGSGVPAYAKGTAMTAIGGSSGTSSLPVSVITSGGVVTGGGYTLGKPEETTDNGNKTSSGNTNGGGNSGPKIDEKAFENLTAMVDYIVKRIGEALDEQLDIIDKQIDALKQQKDALDAQNELEEKQKAVAEAQRDLETALSERTIRYLGEDGKWHWMADARNVQTAQENLQKAQDALSEYQNKAAYEAEVAALEAQKKALQEEYTNITDAWSKIQSGVETPTGDLAELISSVLTGGTPQQQTGANAIRDYLIGSLLTGGSYAGNYSEALDSIAKATAGSPIMPDGSGASLASLIATGGGLTGSTAEALRVMNGGVTGSVTGAFGDGGTHINYNYFVNGMEIGAEAAQGMTLSEVMRSLTVYAGQ